MAMAKENGKNVKIGGRIVGDFNVGNRMKRAQWADGSPGRESAVVGRLLQRVGFQAFNAARRVPTC